MSAMSSRILVSGLEALVPECVLRLAQLEGMLILLQQPCFILDSIPVND